MSAMAFFSATPIGKEESVSKYVAKVVKKVKDSGLAWQLTPMGTIVEGDNLKEVLTVISEAVEELKDVNRISISIKVDYRRDRKSGFEKKVESVLSKLEDK
ncbi:MTH1187 family thiamine-binding protein [Deferribacter thermophilus]|uniref:MTH1187 family thiamine-binding protein n=1 Tax=Deferribacter thermophilus TaxID=53573 RepID=UPI003C2A214F